MKKNRYQHFHKKTQQKESNTNYFNTFIEASMPVKTQQSQFTRQTLKIKRVKTRKNNRFASQVQNENTSFQQLRNRISLLYNKKSKNKDNYTVDNKRPQIQTSECRNKKVDSRTQIKVNKSIKNQDSKYQFPKLAKKCRIFPKRTSKTFYQDISAIFGQKTFYKKQN